MADVSAPAHTASPWEDERHAMREDEPEIPVAGAAQSGDNLMDNVTDRPSAPPVPPVDAAEPREAPVTVPLVDRDRWVTEQEFWKTQSFIAVSGRHAVPRPELRPIAPPQRFRPIHPWKSYPVLAVLCLAILLSCIGAVQAMRIGATLLQPTPTAIPTATHPAPTATPLHHK
jgi:hypothetical protein